MYSSHFVILGLVLVVTGSLELQHWPSGCQAHGWWCGHVV